MWPSRLGARRERKASRAPPVNVSVVDEHADAVHSQSKKDPRQFATKVENDGEQ